MKMEKLSIMTKEEMMAKVEFLKEQLSGDMFVDMDIKDSWIDLWQILAITCFGAYFGGRSYEKVKK